MIIPMTSAPAAIKVNGKKILIRGGGWADELLLHEDKDNIRAQSGIYKGDESEHHPA